MRFIIVFVVGIIMGSVVANAIFRRHTIGSLRIDNSDTNDEPYLFLEMTCDVGDIYKHKYVLMDVKNESYISQK